MRTQLLRGHTIAQGRCEHCAPCSADGMRIYFLPPRFYSTEFPYAGLKLKMVWPSTRLCCCCARCGHHIKRLSVTCSMGCVLAWPDEDSAGACKADAGAHTGIPQAGAVVWGARSTLEFALTATEMHLQLVLRSQRLHERCWGPQALRKAGLGDANLAQLAEWHLQLQAAFERMANIKEYRRVAPHADPLHMPCHAVAGHPQETGPSHRGLRHLMRPTLGQLRHDIPGW